MSQETSVHAPQKTKKRLEKSKVPEPDSDGEETPSVGLNGSMNQPINTPAPAPIAVPEPSAIDVNGSMNQPTTENKMPEVFKRRKYILSEEAKEARRMNLENARKVRAELAIIRANLKKEDFEAKRSNRQERLERIEQERRLKMEQEIEEEVGRRVMRELSERPVQVRSSSQTRRHVQVVAPSTEIQQQKPQFNVVFH